jgi:ribosomal protein L40E
MDQKDKNIRMQTQIFSGPPEEDFGADALQHDDKCPNCQAQNSSGATVCSKCGVRLLKKATKAGPPGLPGMPKPPGQA